MVDKSVFLGVEDVIASLGCSQFSEVFLKLLNTVIVVEHFSLVQLGVSKARFITSANSNGITLSKSLQKLYLTRYFKMDPNIRLLSGDPNNNEILLNRLTPKDIQDVNYQKFFGYDSHIVDRVSLLKNDDKGLYCLNLYRFNVPFLESEVYELYQMASLLMSCALKHTRLAGGLSNFLTRDSQLKELEQRLTNLSGKLTDRELGVCSRVLLGLSSEGIALDLGIKITSVQTYRKRAYDKLNICSQNELFGLCLRNE